MKRRGLLVAGAAVAAGGALLLARMRPPPGAAWKRSPAFQDLGPEIGALVEAAGGAGATGERLTVLGADVAPLAARLRTGLGLQRGAIPTPAQARRLLASAISDDFAGGRVIVAEGWVLSETEATLARLRWLVAGKVAVTEPLPADDAPIVTVEDWGPRNTVAGVPFGQGRDGDYRLWIKARDAPPWTVLRVDGKHMQTFVTSKAIAARIRDPRRSLISKPGKLRLELFDPPTGRVQPIGEFEVLPRPEPFVHADGSASAVFCVLHSWGPTETTVGVAQNPQPDGSMGLWIKTSCVPSDSAVFLGNVRLKTAVLGDHVTATVPLALLQSPGTHALQILHFGSKERLPVGELRVLPPG